MSWPLKKEQNKEDLILVKLTNRWWTPPANEDERMKDLSSTTIRVHNSTKKELEQHIQDFESKHGATLTMSQMISKLLHFYKNSQRENKYKIDSNWLETERGVCWEVVRGFSISIRCDLKWDPVSIECDVSDENEDNDFWFHMAIFLQSIKVGKRDHLTEAMMDVEDCVNAFLAPPAALLERAREVE